MATETKTNLTHETIDSLQELIQVNIDSRDGLNDAAEHITNKVVAVTLQEIACQRNDQVSELRTLVAANDQEPESAGSILAAAHRTWMDLRSALGGGTQCILNEAERGEDHIKGKYEDALKKTAGSAVTDVLNRQYAVVKAAHDKVKALRDSQKE